MNINIISKYETFILDKFDEDRLHQKNYHPSKSKHASSVYIVAGVYPLRLNILDLSGLRSRNAPPPFPKKHT